MGVGAWGRSAEWAFEQVLEAKEATLCPELVDFNIMNFGEHWRQCIAAAMAKGLRRCFRVRRRRASSRLSGPLRRPLKSPTRTRACKGLRGEGVEIP